MIVKRVMTQMYPKYCWMTCQGLAKFQLPEVIQALSSNSSIFRYLVHGTEQQEIGANR